MKQTTKNGIVAFLIVAAIAGGIYYISTRKKVTKEDYILEIIKNPAGLVGDDNSFDTAYNALASFDEPFLKAWYYGLIKKQASFEYDGRLYKTGGGKAL